MLAHNGRALIARVLSSRPAFFVIYRACMHSNFDNFQYQCDHEADPCYKPAFFLPSVLGTPFLPLPIEPDRVMVRLRVVQMARRKTFSY